MEYGMASRHALFEGQSDEETKAADGENRYHPGGERRLVEHQVLALPGCAGRQCGPRWGHRRRHRRRAARSEEHTSELQSLMRTSYAVFRLKKKITYSQTAHVLPA